MSDRAAQAGGGLLESAKGLGRTLLEALQTRLRIAANELEEQGARLAHVAVLAAVCGFFAALAVVLAVFFVVVLYWESKLVAIGVLFAIFLAGAVISFLLARAALAERPKFLSAMLSEIDKDREALK